MSPQLFLPCVYTVRAAPVLERTRRTHDHTHNCDYYAKRVLDGASPAVNSPDLAQLRELALYMPLGSKESFALWHDPLGLS